MCVASLNLSTRSCAHRWYSLIRPCHPDNHLSNCPDKLKLEGWETRTEACPWCEDNEMIGPEATRLLLGGSSCQDSGASSPSSPALGVTRSRRSNSNNTLNSLPGLSRSSTLSSLGELSRCNSNASSASDQGQRHRDMNERLHTYLTLDPHELLPSAAKNYPTYSRAQVEDNGSSELPALKQTNSVLKRQWRRSVRISQGFFKI